jgi:hypothetical protein
LVVFLSKGRPRSVSREAETEEEVSVKADVRDITWEGPKRVKQSMGRKCHGVLPLGFFEMRYWGRLVGEDLMRAMLVIYGFNILTWIARLLQNRLEALFICQLFTVHLPPDRVEVSSMAICHGCLKHTKLWREIA